MEGWSVILLLSWFMTGAEIDTRTVKEVDLNRYMGVWYEIARMDHRFERGLVGPTAEYSLKANGKIRVINRGYKRKIKDSQRQGLYSRPCRSGKTTGFVFPFYL